MVKKLDWRNAINAERDWKIVGISFFGRDSSYLLKRLVIQLKKKEKELLWIATVNPEFIMKTLEDKVFLEILQKKTLNIADGVGLIWAKHVSQRSLVIGHWGKLGVGIREGINVLKGKYQNEVIAGSSLMGDLCKVAAKEKMGVFFLGGWKGRAKKTARNFQFSILNFQCEWCSGRPEFGDEEILEKIRKYRPKMLFVAYGMKAQEEWIDQNYNELQKAGVGLVMGVGRSFDYYSGDLKRAPVAWRKMGLEWLYSLVQEPWRWRRQLALPRFAWWVLKEEL